MKTKKKKYFSVQKQLDPYKLSLRILETYPYRMLDGCCDHSAKHYTGQGINLPIDMQMRLIFDGIRNLFLDIIDTSEHDGDE